MKIAIIGAGPTGLSCAYRLRELEFDDFIILEQNSYVGGLCSSFKDSSCFTWDVGGHVIYSSNEIVLEIINDLLKYHLVYHLREAFVKYQNILIPFPFQNNIRHLPNSELIECFNGLLNSTINKNINFKDWILNNFGSGISNCFMIPYNEKIWNYPLDKLSTEWAEKSISIPEVKKLFNNIILKSDDVNHGSNVKFMYPKIGGVGYLFEQMQTKFKDKIELNVEVVKINPSLRNIYLNNGNVIKYDCLINTSPLDKLINMLDGNYSDLVDASKKLKYNNIHVFGFGFDKLIKNNFHWLYFPEKKYVFYRVSQTSKYAPDNTNNSKIIVEITDTGKYTKEELKDIVLKDLIKSRIIDDSFLNNIKSYFYRFIDRGYPIPTVETQSSVNYILNRLELLNIFSRGRLGAWSYNLGSMQDAMLQGVEIAGRIVNNEKEKLLNLENF